MSLHESNITEVIDPGPWRIAKKFDYYLLAMVAIGAILWLIGWRINPLRGWSAYLINFLFVLFLTLSGVFFTALEYVTNADWSTALRRIPEGIASFLPFTLIFMAIFAIAVPSLYSWHADWVNPEGLTRAVTRTKVTWLSQPFFTIRNLAFIIIWSLLGWAIVRNSLKQDNATLPHLSRVNAKLAIAFMILYALSFSVASYDLLMSLEPNWYSTMFGVYTFIGMFQSGIALIAILAIRMRKSGALPLTIDGHIRDLGGFVFAMSVFMSYIGFCQFLLIWYANLPDETFYFIKRTQEGWWILLLMIAALKFLFPFVLLMSQQAKKNEKLLTMIAIGILIGEWLDLYWMVIPTHTKQLVLPGIADLGGLLLFLGLFGMPVVRFYRKHSMLATGDPKILTSINWRG